MILITTYYKSTNDNRNKEIDKCLIKNFENNYIKKIYLLNNDIYNLSFINNIIKEREHHWINYLQFNNKEEYQYKIAEDVIIEAYLMSKVDLLMCCEGSNVNHLSRTINPNLPTIDVEPRNPGY